MILIIIIEAKKNVVSMNYIYIFILIVIIIKTLLIISKMQGFNVKKYIPCN